MIWGIDDENHQLTGTIFDYQQDVSNEPFKHFLARQLNPSINFEFYEDYIDDKRVVLLYIPAAKNVPRFIIIISYYLFNHFVSRY